VLKSHPDARLTSAAKRFLPKQLGSERAAAIIQGAQPTSRGETGKLLRWAFDLETLGVQGPGRQQIGEIGFVQLGEDFLPTSRVFRTNVRRTAEELATEEARSALATNRLSPANLLNAPTEDEARRRLLLFLEKRIPTGRRVQLVGHNIDQFDIPILKRFLGEETYHRYFASESVDTLDLARRYERAGFPGSTGRPYESWKLGSVAHGLGLEHSEGLAHGAIYDASQSGRVANLLYPLVGKPPMAESAAREVAETVPRAATRFHIPGRYLAIGATAAALMLVGRRNQAEEEPPLVHVPRRGMGAAPFEEIPSVKPLGDYNRRLVSNYYEPKGGLVQAAHDSHRKSHMRSQRARLSKHPSGAFRESTPPPRGPITTRRERQPTWV